MFSRYLDNGVPFDTQFTWPGLRLKYFLDDKLPWLMRPIADRFMRNAMISMATRSEPLDNASSSELWKRTEQRMRNEWHLLPCASVSHVHPAVQEAYIPALRNGDITPLKGFKDFAGENQVLLEDGSIIEVDAVIFCTGYKHDWSIMPELEMDGTGGRPLKTSDELFCQGEDISSATQGTGPHIPRLFHLIFPPRWASSIAFLSWLAPQENAWCISELVSMAVAQVFAAETVKASGMQVSNVISPALLPSLDAMDHEVNEYHAWFRKEWQKEPSIRQGYVRPHHFYRFLHGAAGTGLYEKVDHLFAGGGFRLWWNDYDLWTWITKGPLNSYSWRVFETNPEGIPGFGRRSWPGARSAIKEAVCTYK